MRKRIFAILLAVCMVIELMPRVSLAIDDTEGIRITDFTVAIDNGDPISLLGGNSELNLTMGEAYAFTIIFDKPDEVKKAYVTSTKDGEKYYLAAFNNGSGTFITHGYFADDANYIPGTISVEYSKSDKHFVEDGNWLKLKSPLNAEKVHITTNSSDSIRGSADLSDLLEAESDAAIEILVEMFDATASTDLSTWLDKYRDLEDTLKDLEDGKILCIDQDSNLGDPGTYVAFFKSTTDSAKYFKVAFETVGDSAASLVAIADLISQDKEVASFMSDYIDIRKEKADLKAEIDASLEISNKVEAYEKLDTYANDRVWFSLISTLLPPIVVASGGTMVIPGLIFTSYLALITAAEDYFWDYRVGLIVGSDPVDGVFQEGSDHGEGWIPLTNEFLRNSGWAIQKSGNYYLAEDITSLYIGNPDENMVAQINVTLCFHGHNIGPSFSDIRNVAQSLHLKDCRYIDSDTENMYGSATVSNEGGTLTISNCCIGNITNNSGTITLNNCRSMSEVTNLSGTMNISGATTLARVYNNGTLNISSGEIINTKDRGHAIYNRETGVINFSGGSVKNTGTGQTSCLENFGKITITKGTFENIGASGSNYCIYNRTDGEVMIKNGTINSVGGFGCAIKNEGKLTIRGGTVTSNYTSISNRGELTLEGGKIESIGIKTDSGSSSIVNSGTMTMNGGTVKADGVAIYDGMYDGISNESDGILQINGGILQAERALTNWGRTVMTHGTILGCISNHYNDAITFSIGGTSVIELKNNDMVVLSSGSELPIIKADIGYTGGITYFDDLNPEGVWSTIDNAAEIDFITYYLRIEGDDATNDSPNPCEHDYILAVTPPTCTNQGYTTYTCSLCGKNYTDNYVTALGHRYGEWVTIKEPTAAASGQKERICSVCGDRQVSTIPATGGSGNVTPSTPGKPSNPEKPVEKPAESEKPDESITPIQPETPVQPERPSIPVYVDVAPDAWYNEATAYVASRGLMTGTSATNFSPDEQMTRAQAWTLLARMSGSAVEGSTPWYAGAQAWAVSAGISDGTDPDGNITREQLAVMLYRQAGSPLTAADLSGFADHSDVSGWALPAIEWAVSVGLLQGDGARLNPAAPATRAEVAALLMRFCENTGK